MEFVILAIPYMRRLGEQVGRAGSDPNRFQALMANLRTQMTFAESVGYTGFCMTEQHLQVEGIETTTNPLFWDYFVAQHTERIRVGQLGMNLTAVNPIQLAENLAMLDHFTGGRMFAGFTRGNTPRWTGTFGQHIGITATHSDKSEVDRRNRRAFEENWRLVKALWTQEVVSISGEFWQAPPAMDWSFAPTSEWSPGSVTKEGKLKEIGSTKASSGCSTSPTTPPLPRTDGPAVDGVAPAGARPCGAAQRDVRHRGVLPLAPRRLVRAGRGDGDAPRVRGGGHRPPFLVNPSRGQSSAATGEPSLRLSLG